MKEPTIWIASGGQGIVEVPMAGDGACTVQQR